MKVLTRGFYGISADVNQAENKKQHHDLFYMKWNFAPLLNLREIQCKYKYHVGFFFAPNFLFFIALSFMFFTFFTLKLHFSEILMTRYLAVVLKVTGKQTITRLLLVQFK